MAVKIKLHTFHVLFRLFAYLADKTGGWLVFVSPKLLIGSLILVMGSKQIHAQNQKQETPGKKAQTKSNTIKANLKDSRQSLERDDHTLCYMVIEKMPAFPEGEEKLVEYVSKKLVYPKEALAKEIQGTVICKFMVNEDGSITNIEVIKRVYPLLDAEAIRVIKTLPKFIPGTQHNKPVGVYFTLPIKFSIQKKIHVPKN